METEDNIAEALYVNNESRDSTEPLNPPPMTLAEKLRVQIGEKNILVDPDHLYHLSFFLKLDIDQYLDQDKLDEIMSSFLNALSGNEIPSDLAERNSEFTFIFTPYKPMLQQTKESKISSSKLFDNNKYCLKINLPTDEPQQEALQLFSTILVETFQNYDLNLIDQSFEEKHELIVIKTEFPPFVLPASYEDIIKNTYSTYGEIISWELPQEKESKKAFNIKFHESPKFTYTVLKLNSPILPPKSTTISVSKAGKTNQIGIISYLSTAPKHCVYCRSTEHSTFACPVKPGCKKCFGANHRGIFCPKLNSELQESLFNTLHPKTRENFLKRVHPQVKLPLWALTLKNRNVNNQTFYFPSVPRTTNLNDNRML
jgi:hypothetical protein